MRRRSNTANHDWRKQVERQRLKYNLLGILVLLVIICLVSNVGGCGESLGHFLTG